MNREAERKLKFDRRLHGRRDLVSEEEQRAHLDGLPDVSDKIQSSGGGDAETRPTGDSAPEGSGSSTS